MTYMVARLTRYSGPYKKYPFSYRTVEPCKPCNHAYRSLSFIGFTDGRVATVHLNGSDAAERTAGAIARLMEGHPKPVQDTSRWVCTVVPKHRLASILAAEKSLLHNV